MKRIPITFNYPIGHVELTEEAYEIVRRLDRTSPLDLLPAWRLTDDGFDIEEYTFSAMHERRGVGNSPPPPRSGPDPTVPERMDRVPIISINEANRE